jgi:hypothetical protein
MGVECVNNYAVKYMISTDLGWIASTSQVHSRSAPRGQPTEHQLLIWMVLVAAWL